MDELLSLKWNNHRSTFLHILTVLRDKQLYTDATLACDGKFYSVHRLVLSTCSDYFSAMFDKTTECKNPIIVLKDIKSDDLEALLDYMYLGEVNVRQADLASLIKSAECLQVKGLAVPDDEPPKKTSRENLKRSEGGSSHSPPSKRKRRENQDGREDVRPPSSSRSKSPPPNPRLSPSQIGSESQSRLSPSQASNDKSRESTSAMAVIKQEASDEPEILLADDFDPNEDFKEEATDDPGGTDRLNDDLPDFLQDSDSSFSQSFAGTSYQQDLQNWQGDQNFSDLGYSQSQDGSQNASGTVLEERLEHQGGKAHFRKQNSYTCDVCGKCISGYNLKQNIKRHRMIHDNIRPYRCPHCPHSSNRKDSLKFHIRSQHYSTPDFSFFK